MALVFLKMTKSWLPLEANPEVLTSYAHRLGLPMDYAFHDVLAVEPWALESIPKPILAILLLFPISDASETERLAAQPQTERGVYFMKQTVGNACGTIAVLHALLNLSRPGSATLPFASESFIQRMIISTWDLSSGQRGHWLENDTEIEKAHIQCESFGQSESPASVDEVDMHFITFVNHEGVIMELDGRREGPIFRGKVANDSEFGQAVLDVVRSVFIANNPDDIRFSILALSPISPTS